MEMTNSVNFALQAIYDRRSPGFTFQQSFAGFHEMENLPFTASKPFRFLVGPDKKAFMMHADLVAHLSKPLAVLINGKMKEAREGYAELPEVDERTFVRFCQFAYTGDYKVPAPTSSELADTPSTFIPNTWFQPNTQMGKPCVPSPARSMTSLLWDSFKGRTYTVPNPQPPPKEALQSGTPPVTTLEVFLSHARVYVLADYYDIERLRILSVKKLHKSLASSLSPKTPDCITPLVKYCFENTVDKCDAKDPLRELVTGYMACKIDQLWKNDAFQDLVGSSGELSKALVGALADEVAKPWDTLHEASRERRPMNRFLA
ncbi:hypothetical protein F4809DRAFT_658985 [Biscogniauxia mediterranea]|nr:hypothetical protein F4809DRAFT_658985 [Biscogniauxia mediterranea]